MSSGGTIIALILLSGKRDMGAPGKGQVFTGWKPRLERSGNHQQRALGSCPVIMAGAQSFHHFGWYIVYNGKLETWHRKADYMEEILVEIHDPIRSLQSVSFTR